MWVHVIAQKAALAELYGGLGGTLAEFHIALAKLPQRICPEAILLFSRRED